MQYIECSRSSYFFSGVKRSGDFLISFLKAIIQEHPLQRIVSVENLFETAVVTLKICD